MGIVCYRGLVGNEGIQYVGIVFPYPLLTTIKLREELD